MGGDKGKGGSSFPNSRSDIEALIRMQEDANVRAAETSARFNLFDIFTPFGTRRFEGTPGEEDFRQIEELPEEERQYLERSRLMRLAMQNLGQQQLGQAGDIFGMPIAGGAEEAARLEQATFDRGRNLMQPGFEEDRARLENQLVQRGIPRGSAAYGRALEDLEQRQGTALENLALSSVQAGRQEQSRQLQSELARRSGIINELGALGMGGASAPAFQATPSIGVGAADVMGPVNAVNQNVANQNAAKAAGKGGATQLASAGMLAFGGNPGGKSSKGGAAATSPQVGSQFNPFASTWT